MSHFILILQIILISLPMSLAQPMPSIYQQHEVKEGKTHDLGEAIKKFFKGIKDNARLKKYLLKEREYLSSRSKYLAILAEQTPSNNKKKMDLLKKMEKLLLELSDLSKASSRESLQDLWEKRSADYHYRLDLQKIQDRKGPFCPITEEVGGHMISSNSDQKLSFHSLLELLEGINNFERKAKGTSLLDKSELIKLAFVLELVGEDCIEQARFKNEPVFFHRKDKNVWGELDAPRSFHCAPNGDIVIHFNQHPHRSALGRGKFKTATLSYSLKARSLLAKVSLATEDREGEKQVTKQQGSPVNFKQTLFEIAAMEKSHGLPGLLGASSIIFYSGRKNGVSVPKLAFISELQEGTLQNLINNQRAQKKLMRLGKVKAKHKAGEGQVDENPLTSIEKVLIAKDVLQGLKSLKELGIHHRDIKPANIFLKRDDLGRMRAKIGDFGLGRWLNDQDESDLFSLKGTMAYLAPERVMAWQQKSKDPQFVPHQGQIGPVNDLYAAGISLYELIFNEETPWLKGQFSSQAILSSLANMSSLQKKYQEWDGHSGDNPDAQLKSLIYRMIHPDYTQRPPLEDVLQKINQIEEELKD